MHEFKGCLIILMLMLDLSLNHQIRYNHVFMFYQFVQFDIE